MAKKSTAGGKGAGSSKRKAKKAAPTYTLKQFYLEDHPRTLFPLDTNRILIERGAEKISEFIEKMFDDGRHFLPQRTVHANKDRYHLRRTAKLDPVAEYYIYDLVFRNRSRFRKPHNLNKKHFGYRFEGGKPLHSSSSYRDFKQTVWLDGVFEAEKKYLSFDIASYFNNLYHHDLNAWFSALGLQEQSDSLNFGKFLREINAGRSLDCLPQGLYPTKMIGNDFLRFIEENCLLKSEFIYRFMDDICLVDDSQANLNHDFDLIQRLLGQKGLSINSAKTSGGTPEEFDSADEEINELKKKLLQRRRAVIISHYDELDDIEFEDSEQDDELPPLTEAEIEFATKLLESDHVTEEDAELVLIVMKDHVNRIKDHLNLFAESFPHLAKNFYLLCGEAEDKEHVAEVVKGVLVSDSFVGEYQLFWFGMMLSRYLMDTQNAKDILSLLYDHPNATDITRAKLLEIQDNRFGLSEFREGFLREGRSDWLAWSSAVGSLALGKDARNYLLGYFKNGSEMNSLVAEVLENS